MCVIAVQPADTLIDRQKAKNCFDNNDHGCGYAYVRDGEVKIQKGFRAFETFWESFSATWEKNITSPFLLHFRIATAGTDEDDNLHPFKSTKGSAFAHNGTIGNFKNLVEHYSDSRTVANVLRDLDVDPFSFEGRVLLQGILGTSNKGVFLFPDKRVAIFNSSAGKLDDGIWYSNGSFAKAKIVKRETQWSRCSGCQCLIQKGATLCRECASHSDIKSLCRICNDPMKLDREIEFGTCDECWDGVSEHQFWVIPR